MRWEELKSEALKLSVEQRVALAKEILASLDELSDQEIEALWVEEAQLRDIELADAAQDIPASDVLARARARLK